MTEQSTKLDGNLSFLTKLSEQVEFLEDQIIKRRYRLPELTDDESKERVVSAVEVREELDEFKEVVLRKIQWILTNLGSLQESVRLLENDREESWEAISHKVSTLVEGSVESLTERLTELEQTVQSRRTTPITDDDILNEEAWSPMEQASWSEMARLREHVQEVPGLYTLCERLHENQKSQEKQLSGLRGFARQVEQCLDRMNIGATAPGDSREAPRQERANTDVSLGYVPGASASSSSGPPLLLRTPKPPTIPAPPIPEVEVARSGTNAPSPGQSKSNTTHFSTVRSKVRSGAIRIDITDPEQWSAGDVAVIQNQEAKKVRDIGSLIVETPIQHDYEAGVEVRSLLSTEQLEEVDGRLAVLDVDPSSGTRFVRFWVDDWPGLSGSQGSQNSKKNKKINPQPERTPKKKCTRKKKQGASKTAKKQKQTNQPTNKQTTINIKTNKQTNTLT